MKLLGKPDLSNSYTVQLFNYVLFLWIFIFRELGGRGWGFEAAAMIIIFVTER